MKRTIIFNNSAARGFELKDHKAPIDEGPTCDYDFDLPTQSEIVLHEDGSLTLEVDGVFKRQVDWDEPFQYEVITSHKPSPWTTLREFREEQITHLAYEAGY